MFALVLVLVGTILPLPDPIHPPLSIGGFVAIMIAIFVVARELRRDAQWQRYGSYSLVAGMVSVGLFLFIGATGQGVLAGWFGLLQRLFLAQIFIWIEVMAIRLLVVSNHPRP